MITEEEQQRLVEIQSEMVELLKEAKKIIRNDTVEYQLAQATWIAYLESGLGGVNKAGCNHTMQNSINALEP